MGYLNCDYIKRGASVNTLSGFHCSCNKVKEEPFSLRLNERFGLSTNYLNQLFQSVHK
jgi:hypothetical protein